MNAPTLARPLRLGRPWPLRLVEAARERLGAWLCGVQAVWSRLRAAQHERLELDAAADLSAATLRDMGAPDWLQAQAQARHEARRFERELMRVELRGSDGRYY